MDFMDYITVDGRLFHIKSSTMEGNVGDRTGMFFDVRQENDLYTPVIKISRTQQTIWNLSNEKVLSVLVKLGVLFIENEIEKGTDLHEFSYMFDTNTVPTGYTVEDIEKHLTQELHDRKHFMPQR